MEGMHTLRELASRATSLYTNDNCVLLLQMVQSDGYGLFGSCQKL